MCACVCVRVCVRVRVLRRQIFGAVEKHCRTKYGYSGVYDVQQEVVRWNNQMPRCGGYRVPPSCTPACASEYSTLPPHRRARIAARVCLSRKARTRPSITHCASSTPQWH